MNCDKTELLELLKQFVAFETVASKPESKRDCLNWIQATFFTNWKHAVEEGECKKAPYIYMEHPEAEWIWFAHIDVVPAPSDMFALTYDDEKAYGRGAKDMKGSSIPFLMALRDTLKQGLDPKVSLLLTSDEEIAGETIPHLFGDGMTHPPIAYTPDSLNDSCIILEQKGIAWLDIVLTGKGGHAAAPWAADNPFIKMAEVIQVLDAAFPSSAEDSWHVTAVPTQVTQSKARNMIPESITLGIDVRFPAEEIADPEQALQKIQSVLPDWCKVKAGGPSANPLLTDGEHPFIENIQNIASDVIGRHIPKGKECGASDARFFASEGVPAFIFGPLGGGLHADNEWISIESMLQHYTINHRLLQG